MVAVHIWRILGLNPSVHLHNTQILTRMQVCSAIWPFWSTGRVPVRPVLAHTQELTERLNKWKQAQLYWVSAFEQLRVQMVADCTGHSLG